MELVGLVVKVTEALQLMLLEIEVLIN